jgi:hypothetical protein
VYRSRRREKLSGRKWNVKAMIIARYEFITAAIMEIKVFVHVTLYKLIVTNVSEYGNNSIFRV